MLTAKTANKSITKHKNNSRQPVENGLSAVCVFVVFLPEKTLLQSLNKA